MTKFESAKRHIELREIFFKKKYNIFQRMYAHSYMYFHDQELIEGANEGLEGLIRDHGDFKVYKDRVENCRMRAEDGTFSD